MALVPLTTSDVLDGAWAVLSNRPRVVLGLSVLFVVPAEVVAAYLLRGYGQAFDLGTAATVLVPLFRTDDTGRALGFSPSAILALAVLSIAYSFLGAAIGRLVWAWYHDTDLTLRQVLGPTLRATPKILVAWALGMAFQLLAFALCGFPGPFVVPLFLLVAPIIGIERAGPWTAIRRSVRLVGRRYPGVLGIWLVSLLVERLLNVALAMVPSLASGLLPEPFSSALAQAGWGFALVLTAPTVAAVAVLLYLDLRVRSEGLDLEVGAGEAFPPLAATVAAGGAAR